MKGCEFMEIWKSLKNIVKNGENYEISNYGKVRSIDRIDNRNHFRKSQIIIPRKDKNGYLRVNFYLNGKMKSYFVHRLVALSFIPNPESKQEINHKDGNKKNNHVDNLEWSTSKENQIHAFDNGLQVSKKGEDTCIAKLKESDVLKIREIWQEGLYTQKVIAKMFNVSQKSISNIILRKTWKHL